MFHKLQRLFMEEPYVGDRVFIAFIVTLAFFFALLAIVFFTWVTSGWALLVFVPTLAIGYFLLNVALTNE